MLPKLHKPVTTNIACSDPGMLLLYNLHVHLQDLWNSQVYAQKFSLPGSGAVPNVAEEVLWERVWGYHSVPPYLNAGCIRMAAMSHLCHHVSSRPSVFPQETAEHQVPSQTRRFGQ